MTKPELSPDELMDAEQQAIFDVLTGVLTGMLVRYRKKSRLHEDIRLSFIIRAFAYYLGHCIGVVIAVQEDKHEECESDLTKNIFALINKAIEEGKARLKASKSSSVESTRSDGDIRPAKKDRGKKGRKNAK